jgi:cyclase
LLTKRIIPCLDIKDGHVFKGTSFGSLRDAGDPVELARRYYEEGADEIVFLDITATVEKRGIIIDIVERVSRAIFIPLSVGGGLKSLEDIRMVLLAGADKVSLNTAAVENPGLVTEAAEAFGRQCIIVAIDAKRRPGGGWEVYTSSGQKATGIDALGWAKKVSTLGAGELMLTSIDTDGHRSGYDIELTRAVSQAVTIPIIASGGAGGPQDLYQVLADGKADAALAASIFHYGLYSIGEVKAYLAAKGIPVRLS